MDKELIERINALSAKARTPGGLTPQEREEQAQLRRRYLALFRENFRQQLSSIVVEDEAGNRRRLTPKN